MKRRTARLLVETERTVYFNREGETAERWCRQCHRWVATVTQEEAVLLAGSEERLRRWIRTAGVHACPGPEAAAPVCADSLAKFLQGGGT